MTLRSLIIRVIVLAYALTTTPFAGNTLSGGGLAQRSTPKVFGTTPNLLRAMHFTGNWGGNRDGIKTLPEEYFSFLAANHIEWLGISVAIFNRAMADPTVRIRYRPTNVTTQSSTIYTFDDNDLVSFIDRLRARGIHVYLTLAFEQDPPDSSQCGTNQYWVPRWVFGEPDLTGPSQNDNCLNPAFWWWNPTHLNYTINVATFWKSYTEIAVKYAAMAQQHGVDILSLGTETDRLFRTRTGGPTTS